MTGHGRRPRHGLGRPRARASSSPSASRSRERPQPADASAARATAPASRRAAASPTAPSHVVGAAAPLALLTPAVQQRCHRHALAHHQRADALGAAELVGAHRHEVESGCQLRQIEGGGRLHRIGVEHGLGRVPAHQLCDLVQGLDRAHLVVGRHHRDQRHLGPDNVGHRVEVDGAPCVDRRHPALLGIAPDAAAAGTTRPPPGAPPRSAPRHRRVAPPHDGPTANRAPPGSPTPSPPR